MDEPRFKSDAFEAIHSAASDLHHAGVVSKQTMREFDELCLAEASRSETKPIVNTHGSAEVQKLDSPSA